MLLALFPAPLAVMAANNREEVEPALVAICAVTVVVLASVTTADIDECVPAPEALG